MKKDKKVAVIGAGIGGIATAIRLSLKGYDVVVYEANNYPGGKLSEFKTDRFRFDAGPSLFTMPGYVDELFSTMNNWMSFVIIFMKTAQEFRHIQIMKSSPVRLIRRQGNLQRIS